MNIKEKMNAAMVEVQREGRKYNTILLGKKEMEESRTTFERSKDEEVDFEQGVWTVTLMEVSQDSFCKAVYIVDEEE